MNIGAGGKRGVSKIMELVEMDYQAISLNVYPMVLYRTDATYVLE
jgi:hypothetical protein